MDRNTASSENLETDLASDEDENRCTKQNFLLEERARALVGQGNFYEAATLLEQIGDLEDVNFGTKLIMAECYLQLGRENKVVKIENSIRKCYADSEACDIDEIISLADEYIADSMHSSGILLLRVAADLIFASSKSFEEISEGVYGCIKKMQTPVRSLMSSKSSSLEGLTGQLQELLSNLVKPLKALDSSITLPDSTQKRKNDPTRMQVIGLDFGVEYMIDALKKLIDIEVDDKEKKAIRLAWICSHIGYNLAVADDNKRSINFRKQGVKIMEDQFQTRANLYMVHGVLLHNIGIVLGNSGKNDEAQEYYKLAIKAKETAADYSDNAHRQQEIEVTKDALKRVRARLA